LSNFIFYNIRSISSFKYYLIFILLLFFIKDNAQNTNADTISFSDTTKVKLLKVDSVLSPKKENKQALSDPFKYLSADSTEFYIEKNEIRLYGNAQVFYQDIQLEADYIALDMNTKEVYAYGRKDSVGKEIGKPTFKQGAEDFSADTIRYNFKTKKGLIKGVFTKQGEGFLHSERNKKMADNSICIKNGKYTTCSLNHPHFYLALTKAKVIPNDKIVSGPAYLVIEDIPLPIGIPFGFFPNVKGGASGIIIPSYGEDLRRGFFLRDGGYYFHINDYVDLKLLGDIYSKGSWGLSTESNYSLRYRFRGKMYAKYSRFIDNGDEPNSTTSSTYKIRWRHTQDAKANPYSRFSADVDFGSTNFQRYNNTSDRERLSSTKASSISYNRKLGNSPFNLSINARQSQRSGNANTSGVMDITLPTVNLSMSRYYPFKRKKRVGKERWYEKIGFSYTGNFKNTVTGLNEDTLWSNYTMGQFRNGLQHRIPVSTNFKLIKYINVSPSASYTDYWYFKSLNRTYVSAHDSVLGFVKTDTVQGFARAGSFMVSVPLTTKLYGMYQIKGKNPIVKAFRHILTPTVSFSWRPDFSNDFWGYYQHIYDDNGELVGTYSRFKGESGQWSGLFGSPAAGKSGLINFNLSNNLEMKVRNRKDTIKGSKIIKLIDRLSFRTGYNMAVDSLNWSNLTVSAGTQIARFLNLDMSLNFNPYAFDNLTGKDINQLLWAKGEIGRLTRANFSTGVRFTSKGIKNKRVDPWTEADRERLRNYGVSDYWIDQSYVDFSTPWSLNLNYSLNYSQIFSTQNLSFEDKITQTINANGYLKLTEKWRISYRTGWDFQKEELAYTSITITRDLHCWEMSFNWVPFGYYQSYYFRLNVKASMLKDLKYEDRKSWLENL